eukprot:6180565-Pleurochrysis_carterae.AAC.2
MAVQHPCERGGVLARRAEAALCGRGMPLPSRGPREARSAAGTSGTRRIISGTLLRNVPA